MKHQGVEYGVQRLAPAKFFWTIYPELKKGQNVVSPDFYLTKEEAEAACLKEIDRRLAAERNAPRP